MTGLWEEVRGPNPGRSVCPVTPFHQLPILARLQNPGFRGSTRGPCWSPRFLGAQRAPKRKADGASSLRQSRCLHHTLGLSSSDPPAVLPGVPLRPLAPRRTAAGQPALTLSHPRRPPLLPTAAQRERTRLWSCAPHTRFHARRLRAGFLPYLDSPWLPSSSLPLPAAPPLPQGTGLAARARRAEQGWGS